jgi:hypothetical protein
MLGSNLKFTGQGMEYDRVLPCMGLLDVAHRLFEEIAMLESSMRRPLLLFLLLT